MVEERGVVVTGRPLQCGGVFLERLVKKAANIPSEDKRVAMITNKKITVPNCRPGP